MKFDDQLMELGGSGFLPEPPTLLDVVDECGGFFYVDAPRGRTYKYDYLVWSPASVLHRGSTGVLIKFMSTRKHPNTHGFGRHKYNRDHGTVTYALYKVDGFDRPIMVIFSNATNRRIA